MKTVFALAALFVAVQASPAVTAAPQLPPVPDCLKPCVASLNGDQCKAAVGTDAQNRCFCQNTAAIQNCALASCASQIVSLVGAQSQAAAACSALLAQPAEQPTAKETGASSASAGTESAAVVGGETGSASAAATGSEAAVPTGSTAASSGAGGAGSEQPAASSGAAASTGSGTSSSGNGTSASTSPKATGSSSASDRVVVGGSVLLAGIAALLAL